MHQKQTYTDRRDEFQPGRRILIRGKGLGTVLAAGTVNLHVRLDSGENCWYAYNRVILQEEKYGNLFESKNG